MISTYYHQYDEGFFAQLRYSPEKSYYYIDFYNDKNFIIGRKVFEGKSLSYVEDAAENWTLNIGNVI